MDAIYQLWPPELGLFKAWFSLLASEQLGVTCDARRHAAVHAGVQISEVMCQMAAQQRRLNAQFQPQLAEVSAWQQQLQSLQRQEGARREACLQTQDLLQHLTQVLRWSDLARTHAACGLACSSSSAFNLLIWHRPDSVKERE